MAGRRRTSTSKRAAKSGAAARAGARATARSDARTAAGAGGATAALRKAEAALRKRGLAYPGAYEEFPWGHSALKVKGKAFAFLAFEKGEFSVSLKLPESCAGALLMPFAAPTGYGLGRSGWVTSAFRPGEAVPVPLLCGWLDESYRAIAPKALAARSGPRPTPPRPTARAFAVRRSR
jgi:predicted DNA-binding protein (MmcQ/YjbR family)